MQANGEVPEVLFWVGCAGSFDDRAKKVTRSFAKILTHTGVNFAVLGTEESCTGDPAKRAGNEFLFQMQAMNNVQVLNMYGIKNIVTTCPHCFNTLKNEYPQFGGHYEVLHHAEFLEKLIEEGKLVIEDRSTEGKKITYHDSCYLGRANGVYEAPRHILEALKADLVEMKRCKSNGLCCGAGGAQMFKEAEKGSKEIYIERAEEAIDTKADTIAVNCPFCTTMMHDGLKHFNKEESIQIKDLSELIAEAMHL